METMTVWRRAIAIQAARVAVRRLGWTDLDDLVERHVLAVMDSGRSAAWAVSQAVARIGGGMHPAYRHRPELQEKK